MPTAFDQADLDQTVKQIRAKLDAEQDTRSLLHKALDAIGALAKRPLRKAEGGDPGTGDSDKPWEDTDVSDKGPDSEAAPGSIDKATGKTRMKKAEGEGDSDANGGDTTDSKPTDIEESWDKLDKADDDPPWLDDKDDEDMDDFEKAMEKCTVGPDDSWDQGELSKADEMHIHVHNHGNEPEEDDDDDDMGGFDDEPSDDAGWEGDDDDMGNGNGNGNGDDFERGMSEEQDVSEDESIADAILQVLQDHIDRHDNGGNDDMEMDKSKTTARNFAKATGPKGSAVAVNKFLSKSLSMQAAQEKRLLALEKAQAWTLQELKRARKSRASHTNALTSMAQAMLKISESQETLGKSLASMTAHQEQLDAQPRDSRYQQFQKSQPGLRQSATFDKKKGWEMLKKGDMTMEDLARWKYQGVIPEAMAKAV